MGDMIIGIRYLTDYAAATEPASRDEAEWPPHPARIFMALAAAHFETNGNQDERNALEWLQAQASPLLFAREGNERMLVTSYVPVNDRPVGRSPGPLQCIPGWHRSKQPRRFPKTWLPDPRVFLLWPESDPTEHRPALEKLCKKVTRIGHSSSLVQMWLTDHLPDDAPDQRWEPTNGGYERHLRVPSSGLLSRLELDHEAGQRPTIGTWQGYRRPGEVQTPVQGSIWDARLIARSLDPAESRNDRLDLVAASQVMQAAHDAMLSQADGPIPEFISGHQKDGAPSQRPHVALMPLAFVGTPHATGRLMGLAVALPQGLARRERFQALAAVGRIRELNLGSLGKWRLAEEHLGRKSLRPEVWTAAPDGARHWATVTPVAFDRHTKARKRAEREEELAEMIRLCCTRIGLPEPSHVAITPVSAHLGVPAAHEFPRLHRKDGSPRRHAHVILDFDEPVCGPIALGAGRYRGYGFCRPRRAEEAF